MNPQCHNFLRDVDQFGGWAQKWQKATAMGKRVRVRDTQAGIPAQSSPEPPPTRGDEKAGAPAATLAGSVEAVSRDVRPRSGRAPGPGAPTSFTLAASASRHASRAWKTTHSVSFYPPRFGFLLRQLNVMTENTPNTTAECHDDMAAPIVQRLTAHVSSLCDVPGFAVAAGPQAAVSGDSG